MYLAVVALTMFILPIASIVIERIVDRAPLLPLVGHWFVFWGVGVRLTLAGLRQVMQPEFTAKQIFHMAGDEATPIVRELGFANLATGVVGLLSLGFPSFVLPVAIASAIFYAAAGALHLRERDRSFNEQLAMVSDLFISVVLAIYAVPALFTSRSATPSRRRA